MQRLADNPALRSVPSGNRRFGGRFAKRPLARAVNLAHTEDGVLAITNVLVATDFDDVSETALQYGRALAHAFGGTLHLFHAIDKDFMRPMAVDPHALREAVLKRLEDHLTEDDRRTLGARAVVEMSDTPAHAIVRYARTAEIDLIVTGTHGRTGVAHALAGSVAEHVVRTAPCPVLTVRPLEREFVVPDAGRRTASA